MFILFKYRHGFHFPPPPVSLQVLTAPQLWVKRENSSRRCVPWGLEKIKVLEIASCQSMCWGSRWVGVEEGRANTQRDARRDFNEGKSAAGINSGDDWSDSDWEKEAGERGRKQPVQHTHTLPRQLCLYKLPIHLMSLLCHSLFFSLSSCLVHSPSPPPTPPYSLSVFGFGQI